MVVESSRLRPLVYLASPYSSDDPGVEDCRVIAVDEIARTLVDMGVAVYSPLSHFAHGRMRLVSSSDAYEHGLQLLSRCDGVVVVDLPEWRSSRGVASEMALADELCLPLAHLEFEGLAPGRLVGALHSVLVELSCQALEFGRSGWSGGWGSGSLSSLVV